MDYTQEQLAVMRAKCDTDLLYFTRLFFKYRKGHKFTVNWHHKEIIQALEDVESYKYELLNINIPPRHSKTELVLNAIARGLGKNPAANYLYITASDELRSETSVSIRDIVTSPLFKAIYGVELKKDQNGKNLWRTNKGGGLKTATIFGQITGFGAGQIVKSDDELIDYIREFEGLICLDDINKVDDSIQMNANNDKVIRTLFNTVLSRKNSEDTPLVNIQQRVGLEDATAKLISYYQGREEKVKNLVYPVIYNGKPLWESKLSMEGIEHQRTHEETAHMFEGQYMQNPQPLEGLLFHKDKMNYYNGEIDTKDKIATLSAIDIADGGGDFHCVIIAYLIENKVFIHDVIFTKAQMLAYGDGGNLDRTINILNEYKPERAWMEINYSGTTYPGEVRKRLNGITGLATHKATTNKHGRIMTESGFIQKHFYFRNDNPHEEYKDFMNWLFKYDKEGNVKHDDGVDTLQILSSKLKIYYGYLWD